MEELPIVLDFDAAGFTLRDHRSVSANDRSEVGTIQNSIVTSQNYPMDLFCDCGVVRREDRRRAFTAASREGGTIDGRPPPALLAEKIEEFKQLQQVRHTESLFGGEFRPLSFALYQASRLVGAFQWYGIRAIEQPNREVLAVRAGFFPALTGSDEEVNFACLRLISAFLERELPMSDGRRLDVVQAVAPTIEEIRPDTLGHRKSLRLYKRADRDGALSVSFQSDPTQRGRGRMRVTKVGRDFVREPEIEDLIRERSGGELTRSDGPMLDGGI